MIANTPRRVAQWLREKLEIYPVDHPTRPIVERLADDEQMASLWDRNEAGSWPWHVQLLLVQAACLYGSDPMLEDLLQPPESRTVMTRPLHELARSARGFSQTIERYPEAAARLWAGISRAEDREVDLTEIDALVQRLRVFAQQATNEHEEFRADFDDLLPPPSRIGLGNARQLAFRKVLDRTLARLRGDARRRLQCDRIVALLESVVFATKVEPESVTRTRQRHARRRENQGRQFS